jgi:hypothetical protein
MLCGKTRQLGRDAGSSDGFICDRMAKLAAKVNRNVKFRFLSIEKYGLLGCTAV